MQRQGFDIHFFCENCPITDLEILSSTFSSSSVRFTSHPNASALFVFDSMAHADILFGGRASSFYQLANDLQNGGITFALSCTKPSCIALNEKPSKELYFNNSEFQIISNPLQFTIPRIWQYQ